MIKLANLDFVQILQIGFTGFAFLLALLTYILLRKEQNKTSPSEKILKQISWFMIFTCFLGTLSIGSYFLEQNVKNTKDSLNQKISMLVKTNSTLQSSNTELKENISKLKITNKAYHDLRTICESYPNWNCSRGKTADSDQTHWRGMTEIEKAVCQFICD